MATTSEIMVERAAALLRSVPGLDLSRAYQQVLSRAYQQVLDADPELARAWHEGVPDPGPAPVPVETPPAVLEAERALGRITALVAGGMAEDQARAVAYAELAAGLFRT